MSGQSEPFTRLSPPVALENGRLENTGSQGLGPFWVPLSVESERCGTLWYSEAFQDVYKDDRVRTFISRWNSDLCVKLAVTKNAKTSPPESSLKYKTHPMYGPRQEPEV